MKEINSKTIEDAVYNLCVKANTQYCGKLYEKLYSLYSSKTTDSEKIKLQNIFKNIEKAKETSRPLCQDTGQVIVFVELGKNVCISGRPLNEAIDSAVERAYVENYFRKSTVKNALFDRSNTKTNSPAIVYTEITNTDFIDIKILIKGAGSENYSSLKMFKPTSTREELFEFVKETITTANEKACPPLVLGIGAGGTIDKAAVYSKQAFFNDTPSNDESEFVEELRKYLEKTNVEILDIKIKTGATHIACMPLALTLNCHSTRHSQCKIRHNDIEYVETELQLKEIEDTRQDVQEINTYQIEELRNLSPGENFLLTGEIYTARDAAHEKMKKYFDETGKLPIELKDKIIFYAGPCPNAPNEIIGPIGPTTSARMDKFCDFVHSNGLLASIGKGERSKETEQSIKEYNGKYFSAQGGIAVLFSQCVKESKIVAFEELDTEAIRCLKVEKLPLKTEI